MILVSDKFEPTVVELNIDIMEVLAVRVNNITIISAYLPPQRKLDPGELEIIFNSANVILMGDLNCKHQDWLCNKSNTNGKILQEFVQRHLITLLHTDEPTLFPTNGGLPSTVDIALLQNIYFHTDIEALNDLDSDHLPLVLTLSSGDNFPLKVPKLRLNYSKADWKGFRTSLQDNLVMETKLTTGADVDVAVSNLTKLINSTMSRYIPKVESTYKNKPLSCEIK